MGPLWTQFDDEAVLEAAVSRIKPSAHPAIGIRGSRNEHVIRIVRGDVVPPIGFVPSQIGGPYMGTIRSSLYDEGVGFVF